MKTGRISIVIGILFCLLVAGGAYYWATGVMDSLINFRSALHNQPPTPGEPVGPPLTHRLVFVLVDALRLDTSLNPDVMPNLSRLRADGAWAVMHSRPPSYSDPGYSVLLTGAWPDLSDGPTINVPFEETPRFTQDDLFSAAHRAGLKTALSGYYWFERLVPQDAVDASFYTPGEDRVADQQVIDAALPWLRSGDFNFILIHIDQVDFAGHHEGGPRDPHWNEAASRADELIGEISSTLDLTRDTLFIASDHGQIDQGGHGGDEPVTLVEPFILVGAGVKAGDYGNVNMVDVAPTLAVLLGANLPASCQGRTLEEMLDLKEIQANSLPLMTYNQQKKLVEIYQNSIGSQIDVEAPRAASVTKIVAAFQSALETARERRLQDERLPRAILAIGAAILIFLALIKWLGRPVIWLGSGAILYNGLFHVRYALLDRLTYSLSSVTSAEDLILYVGITAAISLGIAWILVWWGLRALDKSPLEATGSGLSFTFVVIYTLLLPVLWSYVLNGVFITWTLPDFPSLYLGFISGVQILAVAVLGLLGAGLSALISRIIHSMNNELT
jgi:hypothetical protein